MVLGFRIKASVGVQWDPLQRFRIWKSIAIGETVLEFYFHGGGGSDGEKCEEEGDENIRR